MSAPLTVLRFQSVAAGLGRLPAAHRKRLRTTNMLERLNREIKRRSRIATLFPNKASPLRLATGVLMELSEEWETSKRYLTMEPK